ncbi:MAG TPA: GNAT family N-acetyltransferase [Microbacteriaceae bacterium]|nr:GNAT family N-acetyltransferase [Microbacteriaceae bacterium]
MSISIVPLGANDRADWDPLWAGYLEFYQHELSAQQSDLSFSRLTDAAFPAWGALARDEHGRAVGMVHWLTHPSTWEPEPLVYLEDLFVDPATRGSGVGRALIDYVSRWAHERGHAKVYWQTAADNATARRLYDAVAEQHFVVYEINNP